MKKQSAKTPRTRAWPVPPATSDRMNVDDLIYDLATRGQMNTRLTPDFDSDGSDAESEAFASEGGSADVGGMEMSIGNGEVGRETGLVRGGCGEQAASTANDRAQEVGDVEMAGDTTADCALQENHKS